jgi:hypothetical protein
MEKRLKTLLGGMSTVAHILIVPLFSFVFTILYRPFGIAEALDIGGVDYTFNITILYCILLGSVAITRTLLYLLRHKMAPSRLGYAVWCLGEVVVASLFGALYATLMDAGDATYFEYVGGVCSRLFGIAIYPYALLYLCLELHTASLGNEEVDSSALVKFHDEYQKLKFVIDSSAIIFLRSEENYVNIHYADGERTKKFVLRSSMRALEEQMVRHGLVRCHRSYFLNPSHVKMIRKEPTGMVVAELNETGLEPIPISRKYQDEVTKLL